MSGRRDNRHKLYIDIDLTNTASGEKLLRGLRLIDGYKTFEVHSQKRPVPQASTRAGGCGMMYLCNVNGCMLEVYQEILDDEYTSYWYVAGEQAASLMALDGG
jgi:hypothetical protein